VSFFLALAKCPANFKQFFSAIDSIENTRRFVIPPLTSLPHEREMKRSPVQSACDEERNLQPSQGVCLMESAFPRDIRPNAHASRRVLTLHSKTGSCSFAVENRNLSHEQKKKGSREAASSTGLEVANLAIGTPADLKQRCQSQLLAF
jgi:hypothetical protein